MSIATVVTRGFGSFGSVSLVVTHGYSIAEPAPAIIRTVPLIGRHDATTLVGRQDGKALTGRSADPLLTGRL